MIHFTNEQARRFLLYRQGLLGARRFEGRAGIMDFIHQAGSIQFDPIDVCGRNPDLVLQSRVKGYRKQMLDKLLYEERVLTDYYDKELCIFPVEDWPNFARTRLHHREYVRSHEEILDALDAVLHAVEDRGPLSSKDLGMHDKVNWYWGPSRLSRAALEHLYFRGDLAIHHKRGTTKHYDLTKRCLPPEILAQSDPHEQLIDHQKWLVMRRIGAVGLLWNRASPAWLGLGDFKAERRKLVFEQLLAEDKILPVQVTGLRDTLYCLSADRELAAFILQDSSLEPRCELIAPLDNLIWDRALLKALFNYDYTWEIYAPANKRKYGYYVLPLLYGDRFTGRVECVFDKKTRKLQLKNIWYEEGVVQDSALQAAIDGCLARFEAFHQADALQSI